MLVQKSKESERLNWKTFCMRPLCAGKFTAYSYASFGGTLKNLTSCMGKLCIQKFLI